MGAKNKTCRVTLPKEITKNGREHTFPVGALTVSALNASIRSEGGMCFPMRGTKPTDGKPFNGWSKSKAALDELSGVTDWTLHDLRRTFATIHARIGTPVHVTEKLLNHISGTHAGVVGIYQRHSYMPEMRKAVEAYDAYLSALFVKNERATPTCEQT